MPGETPQTDDWDQWKNHVLAELERMNKNYKTIDEKVDAVRIEIATLKVKSGVWGLIAGAIPVLIALAIYLLTK